MSSNLTLQVQSRSGKKLADLSLSTNSSVDDLKKAFAKKFPRWYPDRQYFTIGQDKNRVTLQVGKKLSEYNLNDNDTIVFKDLGPQIGWRTVFLVEYFGPILMHCLVYFLPQLFYPSFFPTSSTKPHYTLTQQVAFACVVFHYMKREFETIFIHRFSNGTMPIFNIFKNSFHYWILGGISIAYFLYHPQFTVTCSDNVVYACAVLFVLFELGNLYSHIILRNLRPAGTRDRGVPRGFLFEYVTCANYTFELAAWLVFSIFTQTLTAYVFFIVSFGQIAQWSLKKHKALKKEFGDKAPKRKILIPFIW